MAVNNNTKLQKEKRKLSETIQTKNYFLKDVYYHRFNIQKIGA
jgi:hypothetical protein